MTHPHGETILPRGITGFNVPDGHALADPRQFLADCWEVVAPRAGRVEDRPQVLAPRLVSFLTRVLVLPAGFAPVTVLLNRYHPWLGFCRPLVPGECPLEFVDPGPVATAFAALGRYRVLSRPELERPVTEATCGQLGPAELRQLAYWSHLAGRGRLRVGDVVFNFWD